MGISLKPRAQYSILMRESRAPMPVTAVEQPNSHTDENKKILYICVWTAHACVGMNTHTDTQKN